MQKFCTYQKFGGTGVFYPGFEPRYYFQDPQASEPVDPELEIRGFQEWTATVGGTIITMDEVRKLMADPQGGDPEDVFVEETVVRLLKMVGIPLPAELEDFT